MNKLTLQVGPHADGFVAWFLEMPGYQRTGASASEASSRLYADLKTELAKHT